MREDGDALAALVGTLNEQVRLVEQTVDQQAEQLDEASRNAGARASEIGDTLSRQVDQLVAVADQVIKRIMEAGRAFHSESGGLNESVQTALRLMKEVGERFSEQSERLTTALMQAGMQVDDNRRAFGFRPKNCRVPLAMRSRT